MEPDYKIVARIVADDATEGGAAGAERRLQRVERMGMGIGASLGRIFAAMGGTYVLEKLTRSVVSLHSELEQATVGMGTLLSANTGLGMEDSLKVSRDLVRQLRDDAKGGAGELKDYLGGIQTIMGPGIGLGASLGQLRELNRNAMAAGFALRGQEGMGLAGFDVAQALTGQVGDRTTPIVMQALQASGMTAEAFRALRPEERIGALNRAFGAFGPGVEAMGKTWSAQMSTLTDNVKGLLMQVTAPLFERWSEQLRGVNDWFVKHQEQLDKIASTVGGRLVRMWDTLIEKAGTYAALVAAGGAYQAVGGVQGIVGMGQALGRIGRFRNERGQFRSTQLSDLLSTQGLAQIGGALAGMAAPAAPLGLALAALGGAFLSVRGAIREWPELLTKVGASTTRLMEAFGLLGASFDGLSAPGSGLNLFGKALITIGDAVLRIADPMIRFSAALVTAAGWMFQDLGAVYALMGDVASGRVGKLEGYKRFIEIPGANSAARSAELAVLMGRGRSEREIIDLLADDKGLGGIPEVPSDRASHVTNINGPVSIEIKAEHLDDPARVQVALDTIFRRLQANPRQSRRVPGLAFG